MPDYSHPGVYVEETSAPREIEGVPTESAAFVGVTADGPIDEPVEITSLLDYQACFGKISTTNPLSSAIEDFFANGGRKAIVVRAGSPAKRRTYREILGDAKKRTGLHALAHLTERPGMLVMPDAAYLSETDAAAAIEGAAAFAEKQSLFLIADIPEVIAGKGHNEVVRWGNTVTRSRNMALYYPWLVAASGNQKTKRLRPPSAIAAGIYARLDNARGVWKAPAGGEATPKGIADLAQKVTLADSEKLLTASINPIRKFEGRDIALWSARTFAAQNDNEWKYVNVRRLFIFIERSMQEGLAWAVFEPNGEPLWAQIRLEVSSFLNTAWRAGALQGTTAKDAYFVKCDATTMTQNDIDNGHVNVMIGIAPVKPAEFVIFRIGFHAAQETDP